MSSTTSFKWNQAAINNIQADFRAGLARMGFAVANKARDKAPFRTGALKNSVRVTTRGSANDVYVVAGGDVGGKSIRYARIHELGGYAGRKHSVYITPKHYLTNSLEDVFRGDWSKYFKGAA